MKSQHRLFNHDGRFDSSSISSRQTVFKSQGVNKYNGLFTNNNFVDLQTRQRQRPNKFLPQYERSVRQGEEKIFSVQNDSDEEREDPFYFNQKQDSYSYNNSKDWKGTEYPKLNPKKLSDFKMKPQPQSKVPNFMDEEKQLNFNLKQKQVDFNIVSKSQSQNFQDSVKISEKIGLMKEEKAQIKNNSNSTKIIIEEKLQINESNNLAQNQVKNLNAQLIIQLEDNQGENQRKKRSKQNNKIARCMCLQLEYIRLGKSKLDSRMQKQILKKFKSDGMNSTSMVKAFDDVDKIFCKMTGKDQGTFIQKIQDQLKSQEFKQFMKGQNETRKEYYNYLIDLIENIPEDIQRVNKGEKRFRPTHRLNKKQGKQDQRNQN